MTVKIKLTKRQGEALKLLESNSTHTLLYGGARSGKTFLLLLYIIIQSLQNKGIWSLIGRLKFSHAKSSIWKQSLLVLLNKLGLEEGEDYTLNRSDLEVEFNNGSRIAVAGFDSEDRIEKVLGTEYNIIYLNEISQLSYDIVTHVRTRLARKIKGFKNRLLYDCNPPSPLHWAHKEFIEHINPKTLETLSSRDYKSLLINPYHNIKNLTRDYIKILESLPEKEKQRFLEGKWVRKEGLVYYNIDESVIIDKIPPGSRYIFAGVDFGLNMAGVFITKIFKTYYIIGDYGGYNITSTQFNREASKKFKWDVAYCDPSGGERIQEIYAGVKADNSVEEGIDYILQLINEGRLKIHKSAIGLLSEIFDYSRDDKGRIIKENDHYVDAMRYAIYTYYKEVGDSDSVQSVLMGGSSLTRGIKGVL